MEKKTIRWNVVGAIETVCKASFKNKLKVKDGKENEKAVERLNSYLGVETLATVVFCAMVSRFFDDDDDESTYQDLASYFDVTVMTMVKHRKVLEVLAEKHYIDKAAVRRYRASDSIGSKRYKVNRNVIFSLLDNKEIQVVSDENRIDSVSITHQVGELVEERESCDMSTRSLIREVEFIEHNNEEMEFIKETKKILDDIMDRIFFYDTCKDFLSGYPTQLNRTLNDIYDTSAMLRVGEQFLRGVHPLLKLNLIEFDKKGSMSESTVMLSEKGKELFLGEAASIYDSQIDERNMILPEKITAKKLFYSDDNLHMIDELSEAMEENSLNAIQKRLKERNMPVGVAVLLYGAPGTGKTETVYQIAKKTGRAIVHVDISETKSCWFGDSEKLIKKVFSDYRKTCEIARKKGEKIPILLFNEADAVFQKRTDITHANVAKTENAMQNIILEQMESLDGILIATTNLADYMDKAFERRFLFKIAFENPSVKSKKAIWMDKLDWLDEKDAEDFARKYDLSGGEIDNIVRKISMEEIIHGTRPSIEKIDEMCRQEKLRGSDYHNKVGFSL